MASVRGKLRVAAWLFLALSVIPDGASWADTAISFSGTVTAPMPCSINGKRAIVTHFGNDLVTTRIDGSNYLKSLDYTLECHSNSPNALRMQLQGDVSDFNQHALRTTTMPDLAVELRVNGKPVAPNSWFKFIYPETPLLQAVPVKRHDAKLSGGSFYATATMLVDYQ
ncbi:TPA: fimbrial protein [Serratia marcescens]|nr:fimbrial protein [Serratia marcescens]